MVYNTKSVFYKKKAIKEVKLYYKQIMMALEEETRHG